MIDGQIVGWVRSIAVGEMTWCSNMYVVEKHRRRGIGRAMMCRMLRDDREHGATMAVLLASHTGAKLYAAVGYEQIGTLLVFTPKAVNGGWGGTARCPETKLAASGSVENSWKSSS